MTPDAGIVSLETEDQVLTIDGVRLPARWLRPVSAPANAPVLVFLHEGLGSIGLWKDFPEALCRVTGLPGFVYERQGHGGADPLPHGPRPVEYLEEQGERVLPKVLDAAGIEHFIHVGHSDGGSIALLHAATRPPGLRGVVTEAAHVMVEDITLAGIRAARVAYQEGGLKPRLERWHGPNTEGVFWGWNATWLAPPFAAWDMRDRLPFIHCPLLVVQGADDEYGSPAQVTAIAEGTGGPAVPLLIPACGHVPHHQARPTVIEAIRAFLQGPLMRA
ncbi:alpha/beta fold hydrolase [Roseospira visakhapatnamensis]|uniref:Pimeloyl-ACP methyl ester carboxylesterase n=1 Tax=Roseospira visakhapatnamensis TaxID=390880 RepID=A0A7W6WAE4_9PROT|nr:alpha/beta hydrolase [Roseospira visakhapatnamensis]MBB4266406.1 pimeloyl-ACP methyl ester carboxylesterase [Roseospira visakhapatnamensis]